MIFDATRIHPENCDCGGEIDLRVTVMERGQVEIEAMCEDCDETWTYRGNFELVTGTPQTGLSL